MLNPIVLTADGDVMTYFSQHSGVIVDDSVPCGISRHAICRGVIDRFVATRTKDVLMCRICGMRAPIDTSVVTYGDLRTSLSGLQPGSWDSPPDVDSTIQCVREFGPFKLGVTGTVTTRPAEFASNITVASFTGLGPYLGSSGLAYFFSGEIGAFGAFDVV